MWEILRSLTIRYNLVFGGMDVSSEGPINPKSGSSYLFNYRYSYSGLADKISGSKEGLDYQDLAFKVNLPTRHVGTFYAYGE